LLHHLASFGREFSFLQDLYMLDSVVHADSVDGLLQANFFVAWISTIYIFPHGLPSFWIHNMLPTGFAGLVIVAAARGMDLSCFGLPLTWSFTSCYGTGLEQMELFGLWGAVMTEPC
jgi:hypothetical protein